MTVRELQKVFISSSVITDMVELGDVDAFGEKRTKIVETYNEHLGKLQDAGLLDREILMIMNISGGRSRQGIPYLEILLKPRDCEKEGQE